MSDLDAGFGTGAARESWHHYLILHKLYLVTGLKVAKALKFNKSSASRKNAQAAVGVRGSPHNPVRVGVSADAKKEKKQALEFNVDDIVIAYRVNRYKCVKRWFHAGGRTKNKGVLDGNMQDDNDSGDQVSQTVFTLLPIEEATVAEAQAVANGEEECFVAPQM